MKTKLSKNKGITLVSLVITIIVMLILAGVSLSMVTGDSSVLGQAKKTAFMQEMAGYKEELETEILGKSAEYYAENLEHIDKSKIKLAGSYMKEYIPSMKEEDFDDYMIIGGNLYYVGDDEFELGICSELGYVTKAPGQSAEDFAAGLEGGILEDLVIGMAGKAFTRYNEEKDAEEEIGLKLARKLASSGFGESVSDPWTIITEFNGLENVATYADGWYYVKAGETIPSLGTLRNSYIINYAEGLAVKFDSNKHHIFSNEGNLAVVDGLVYNADPTNMPDGSATSWGDAKLHGFTGTVKEGNKVISGWTDTAFITDGDDDYVSLSGDKTYENGVTIEFYGRIPSLTQNPVSGNPGRIHLFAKGIGYSNAVVLGWWNSSQAFWFGYGGHRFWKAPSSAIENKDIYVALRANKDNHEGVIKLNNEDLQYQTSSGFTWDKLLTNLNKTGNDFIFGRGIDANGEAYTALEIYSIRVYNRFLTDEELTANYKAAISYHDILVKDKDVGNSNTGGESIDSIIGK